MRNMEHFSVQDILETGVGVYFRNLRTFAPLTLMAGVPIIAPLQVWDSVSAIFVALLCQFWASVVLMHGVIESLRGEDVSLRNTLRHGARSFMTALLVSVAATVLIIVGSVAFIIPGVVLAMMLYVAVPVAIIERVGVFEALRRSCELTKDYKGRIFALNLSWASPPRLYSSLGCRRSRP